LAWVSICRLSMPPGPTSRTSRTTARQSGGPRRSTAMSQVISAGQLVRGHPPVPADHPQPCSMIARTRSGRPPSARHIHSTVRWPRSSRHSQIGPETVLSESEWKRVFPTQIHRPEQDRGGGLRQVFGFDLYRPPASHEATWATINAKATQWPLGAGMSAHKLCAARTRKSIPSWGRTPRYACASRQPAGLLRTAAWAGTRDGSERNGDDHDLEDRPATG